MVGEVVKEVDVDEVLSEDAKDEWDEIGLVMEDEEANDECGENEGVKDETDDVVLVVTFDDQDEDVIDDCVKVEVDVDVRVAFDVHVEDVVDDLFWVDDVDD